MAKLFSTIGTYTLVLCIFSIFLAPKVFAGLKIYESNVVGDSNAPAPDYDEDADVFCFSFIKVGDRSTIDDCDEFCRNSLNPPAYYGEWHILKDLVRKIKGENVIDLDSGSDYSDEQNQDLVQNGDKEFCFGCTETVHLRK